jgi:hypothetical protein
LGTSEIPVDVRVLLYAADADGKTLVPHLTLLDTQLPEIVADLRYVLADDAYRSHDQEVAQFGQQARLIVPVHGRKTAAEVAAQFTGIDRFTPSGVPVCAEGYRFTMRGRDVTQQRFIWAAPDDEHGRPVCCACPRASSCLSNGQRRHVRVNRCDFPQIDWDHPQHAARDRERYKKRTGVERAIKRIKIDLKGAHLTHRDALRVQAHLDRRLLVLHLLLAAFTS